MEGVWHISAGCEDMGVEAEGYQYQHNADRKQWQKIREIPISAEMLIVKIIAMAVVVCGAMWLRDWIMAGIVEKVYGKEKDEDAEVEDV